MSHSQDGAAPLQHLASWSKPPLALEVFLDAPSLETSPFPKVVLQQMEQLWPVFLNLVDQEGILARAGLKADMTQAWEVELHWTDNAGIRSINREHRGKDSPTDVLSFTLFADSPAKQTWSTLPVVQLGSIFISIEWAQQQTVSETDAEDDAVLHYILERLLHGLLHLLGMHHDTMSQYHKVVELQNQVLQEMRHD